MTVSELTDTTNYLLVQLAPLRILLNEYYKSQVWQVDRRQVAQKSRCFALGLLLLLQLEFCSPVPGVYSE